MASKEKKKLKEKKDKGKKEKKDKKGKKGKNDKKSNEDKEEKDGTESPQAIPIDIPSEQMEKIMEGVACIYNMALSHKLGRPQKPIDETSEKAVLYNLDLERWKVLKIELNSVPPKLGNALRLLEDVKLALCSVILPRHTKKLQSVNKFFDATLIKEQIDAGVIDFKAYSDYVLEVMLQVCCSHHDGEIEKLMENSDNVVATFKGIIALLDQMKLDLGNAFIRLFHAVVEDPCVQKEKFNEFLKSRERFDDCLTDSRTWLMNHKESKFKYQLLNNAYLELLYWNDKNPFPEVVVFERPRIVELRSRLLRLTGCATALVVASGGSLELKGVSNHHTYLRVIIATLMRNITNARKLEEALPCVADHVIQHINNSLEAMTKNKVAAPITLTYGEESNLGEQIMQVANPHNDVRIVLERRLYDYFSSCLEKQQGCFDVPIPAGWGVWKPELLSFAADFCRLTLRNRIMFQEHHTKVIEMNNKMKSKGLA